MTLRLLMLVAAASTTAAAQSSKELPRKHTPEPTTAEITVRDVMTRTYIIADDSMEGRDTGRRGGLRSATYIANELKRLGIEPAGDNGTYFQAIPWVSRSPDPTNNLQIGDAEVAPADVLLMPKLGFALALGGQ